MTCLCPHLHSFLLREASIGRPAAVAQQDVFPTG
jgi:hypothetical protein